MKVVGEARVRAGWQLEHSYAGLPQLFHAPATPSAVREPKLVAFNLPLATMLGLAPDAFDGPDGAAIFAGNVLPEGASPIAQAYAGHQFGHFTALGDGRAILLGEQITPAGDRFDIQLKGAGQTRFSRRGGLCRPFGPGGAPTPAPGGGASRAAPPNSTSSGSFS